MAAAAAAECSAYNLFLDADVIVCLSEVCNEVCSRLERQARCVCRLQQQRPSTTPLAPHALPPCLCCNPDTDLSRYQPSLCLHLPQPIVEGLSQLCHALYHRNCITTEDSERRHNLVNILATNIRQQIYPDSNLVVFGSSANGFGSVSSDLDIYIELVESTSSSEQASKREIIKKLARVVKKSYGISKAYPLVGARVPIVKFFGKPGVHSGDISVDNVLARHNTALLKVYSELDPRVKPLVFALKLLARRCHIIDVVKGGLSSYAYTIIVIHFLQQQQPPILPVLQEMFDEEKGKPVEIVDGWDSWFNKDLSTLTTMQRNETPLGELWVRLVEFCLCEFINSDCVMSIRQKERVQRSEKVLKYQWQETFICIEDPFILSHNLGRPINMSMCYYIIECFKYHYTKLAVVPPGYGEMTLDAYMDYLFYPAPQLVELCPRANRKRGRATPKHHFPRPPAASKNKQPGVGAMTLSILKPQQVAQRNIGNATTTRLSILS